jgi:hypothetical protein
MRLRAKRRGKSHRSPRPARLVFTFDSRSLRDEFRGWLSDGGGEQAFLSDVEYFGDEKYRGVEFDYDYRVVVVKGHV